MPSGIPALCQSYALSRATTFARNAQSRRVARCCRSICMAETHAPIQRPLSPHLGIYRLTLSMVMSGLHRITGLALVAGMVLITWWLLAAAAGQNAYGTFEGFATSWIEIGRASCRERV